MNSAASPILCLAVTPAVQRTQFLEVLQPGEVNRARRTLVTASGKGVNVALALQRLGGRARLLGFQGGDDGRFIVREMQRLGIEARWVEVAAPTRHCHTLVEPGSGRVTELVEEGKPPSPANWESLLDEMQRALEGCAWLALSGALPPGAPPEAWADICRAAAARGVPLCVDSQGEPLRRALAARPAVVKLNTEELQRTLGLPDRGQASIDCGARELLRAGAGLVLVTDGPAPAHLYSGSACWRLQPPGVPLVNPIGSGDSVTAGLLLGLLRGESPERAAAFGLACGSANAMTDTPADLNPLIAERLARDLPASAIPAAQRH